MAPIIMLLAQMYAKQQQQEEARKQEVTNLKKKRVAQLGGDTYGIEAAEFNRNADRQNFASPQELMSIYDTARSGKSDKPSGNKSNLYGDEPKSSDLLEPQWTNYDSFVPAGDQSGPGGYGDDPYGLWKNRGR